MALMKIGFNEGSLLRRTLLHVGTFVLGTVAFIGLTSFALVSVVKLVTPKSGDEIAAADGTEAGKGAKAKLAPTARKGLTAGADRPLKTD